MPKATAIAKGTSKGFKIEKDARDLKKEKAQSLRVDVKTNRTDKDQLDRIEIMLELLLEKEEEGI